MLRGIGVGSGQAHAPVGPMSRRGPHLLSVELPTALGTDGLGAQCRQIRSGSGLTEQLAPDQLTAQRGRNESVDLLGRAVLEDGRHRPPADDQVGSRNTGCSEFGVDEQLLGRQCFATVGPRPVRRQQAIVRHRDLALALRENGDLRDRRGDLRTQMGDGVQINVQLAAHARERQLSDAAQVGRTATQELSDPVGAPQVQVRVVFPRDSDAAEDLYAIFGIGLRGLDSRTGGDRCRDRQLVVGGGGGAQRRGRRRVGSCNRDLLGAQQHLGTHVLDGLKAADRLAELLADLGVVGSGLQGPPRNSGGLRGHQGRREISEPTP